MTDFTVVIPTFNRARLVVRAIESVLRQTLPPRQIIVVDDGSTDGAVEVCRGYAPSVEYIHQPNAGVSAARNCGIRLARHPWTAFLDSDDCWSPNHLEAVAAAIEGTSGGASIYFTDLQFPPGEGRDTLWKLIGFEFSESFLLTPDATDWVLSRRQPCSVPASVFRTEALQAIGGFDERYRVAEDTELFCRLGVNAPGCAVNVVGCIQSDNEDDNDRLTGSPHRNSMEYWRDHSRLWSELLSRLPDLDMSRRRALRCNRADAQWGMAKAFWRSRRIASAAGSFLRSRTVYPALLLRLLRSRGRQESGTIAHRQKPGEKTYHHILSSSALIGGSSAFNVAFRIVRTKVMAMILGPAGVGLLGLYGSVSDLTRSIAGMGINTSGVRQIAAAAGTGDERRVAGTVKALRRTAVACAALGALLLLVFRNAIAQVTFGDTRHGGAIALLALAVYLTIIADARTAVVQSMRRIADLARITIFGSFFGAVGSIAVVYFYFRRGVPEDGVVPSLIAFAAATIAVSWWYSRKIRLQAFAMTTREIVAETADLLKMGVVFMASGFFILGSGYATRAIVVRLLGLEAAGFYHSAWAVGGLYIGFILDAMAADFFPRLTAVADDNAECNRMVNEQAEAGLLLAGPGMVATLAFAPWVTTLLYSNKFGPAVGVLQWVCLGMVLRVVSWPMGYILLAKGLRRVFFWTELIKYSLSVALAWAGVVYFGLAGAGMGFLGMYVAYYLGIYVVVHRISGFSWSPANRRMQVFFFSFAVFVFVDECFLTRWTELITESVALALTVAFSLRRLSAMIPLDQLPPARATGKGDAAADLSAFSEMPPVETL